MNKYRRITKSEAIKYLSQSRTGTEPVWFKTNRNTLNYGQRFDTINVNGNVLSVNGNVLSVYAPVDAGKVFFKYDVNGNKIDVYGYEECKVAYVLA